MGTAKELASRLFSLSLEGRFNSRHFLLISVLHRLSAIIRDNYVYRY